MSIEAGDWKICGLVIDYFLFASRVNRFRNWKTPTLLNVMRILLEDNWQLPRILIVM